MSVPSAEDRKKVRLLDRVSLEQLQLQRLNLLLDEIAARNAFYRHRLGGERLRLGSLAELPQLPLTTKSELVGSTADRLPNNLSFPLQRYVRYHQTSGTRGQPLAVLDTKSDWAWWLACWQHVLDAAGLTASDRALLAFSFGPFIGFWAAHDAVLARGAMSIPTGGLTSLARLRTIEATRATALFCTPTYALRLAEVAREHQIQLESMSIQKIVVAGEPGGSLPAVRERIEQAFAAELIDHAGASEVGAWGFADANRTGLHVLESEFIPEFLRPGTDQLASPGELSELVLTPLGRYGAPLLRYRTGDIVCVRWPDEGCRFALLEGGVVGRADDMLIVRGMNVFPSSIEEILRRFPHVREFRIVVGQDRQMDTLKIEVEARAGRRGQGRGRTPYRTRSPHRRCQGDRRFASAIRSQGTPRRTGGTSRSVTRTS